jgi:hypothetical protein
MRLDANPYNRRLRGFGRTRNGVGNIVETSDRSETERSDQIRRKTVCT